MIKEYLKFDFKKPSIQGDNLRIHNKKEQFQKNLELCYSRLESIEICNSNSKSRDALILIDHLIVDILNLIFDFHDKPTINQVLDIGANNHNIPSEFQTKINEFLDIYNKDFENLEDKSEKLENILGEILYSTDKEFKKLRKKQEYTTPIDKYNKRIKVQSAIILFFFLVFAYSSYRFYKKYQSTHYQLKPDFVQIYYFPNNENLGNIVEEHSAKALISPSKEWKTLNLDFPQPVDIGKIRIDPINQKDAKLEIKEIQFLDQNKNVIAGRDFKINAKRLVDNMEQIFEVKMVKINNNANSEYIQAETIDTNPFFYLDLGNYSQVSSVKLTMRYIEKYKTFNK